MKKITLLLTAVFVLSAASLYAQTAQTRLDNGKRLFDQRNYDGAIKELNEAIRLDPNLAEAYAYRARAYSSKRDNDRAFSDANKSIQLNSSSVLGCFRWRVQQDNRRETQQVADQVTISLAKQSIELINTITQLQKLAKQFDAISSSFKDPRILNSKPSSIAGGIAVFIDQDVGWQIVAAQDSIKRIGEELFALQKQLERLEAMYIQGTLTPDEEMELHNRYVSALQQIQAHCDMILEDEDWKGNL
jgi:Tfp pilus assembly protein PilF